MDPALGDPRAAEGSSNSSMPRWGQHIIWREFPVEVEEIVVVLGTDEVQREDVWAWRYRERGASVPA